MELPYNTTISGDLIEGQRPVRRAGRRLGDQAALGAGSLRALERAGYHVGSAYTAVKNPAKTKFVYRDRLWEGADLLGLGVASFGQSTACTSRTSTTGRSIWRRSSSGEIPLGRAYRPTDEERLIREFVLQLKRGANRPSYFAQKYGVDVLDRFCRRARSLATMAIWRR